MYIIFLILIFIIQKINSELFNTTDENSTLFYLKLYDNRNSFLKTLELHYNPDTYLFDNYDEINKR